MAFATLYTRYNAPVLARISHLVGPGAAVDDLLQETFLRAYNALPAFRSECPFRWWLLRIAMHTVRSAQRSWKRSIFRLFVGDREEAALSQSGRAAAEQYPDLVLVHAGLARL